MKSLLIVLTLSISINAQAKPLQTINSAASDLQVTVTRTQDLMAESVNETHCHSIVDKAEIKDESIQADLYDQCEDQAY